MPKQLKTQKEFNTALKRFEVIFQAKPGTKESDEADLLSLLIREYEDRISANTEIKKENTKGK